MILKQCNIARCRLVYLNIYRGRDRKDRTLYSLHLHKLGWCQKDRCGSEAKEKQLPFFHYLVFKEKIRQKD